MLDRAVHPNTKAVLAAWRNLSGKSELSDRGPLTDDFPGLVGRLFVVQRAENGVWPFRIAGDSLASLLGRELTDQDFSALWRGADIGLVRATLECVAASDAPGLIRGRAETLIGKRVEIEISLAPLQVADGRPARLLGLYQTLGGEPMLRGRPIWRHRVGAVFPPIANVEAPGLKLVASND